MVDVSRRGFLGQAAVATGVGVAGSLGLHKLLATPSTATHPNAVGQPSDSSATGPAMPAMSMDGVSLAGPMVVHVRDLANGEVAMMVGTQELIYRDPELVARLVNTAVTSARTEG